MRSRALQRFPKAVQLLTDMRHKCIAEFCHHLPQGFRLALAQIDVQVLDWLLDVFLDQRLQGARHVLAQGLDTTLDAGHILSQRREAVQSSQPFCRFGVRSRDAHQSLVRLLNRKQLICLADEMRQAGLQLLSRAPELEDPPNRRGDSHYGCGKCGRHSPNESVDALP